MGSKLQTFQIWVVITIMMVAFLLVTRYSLQTYSLLLVTRCKPTRYFSNSTHYI